ncbi:MAG: nucleotide synthetase [Novosphingobium sp.]
MISTRCNQGDIEMYDLSIFDEKGLQSVDGAPFPNPDEKLHGRVILAIKPDLTFVMADDPANPPEFGKFVHERDGEIYIAVLEDSVIEFVLDPSALWEYDVKKGLLVFKVPGDRRYYKVQYLPGQKPQRNLVLHAHATGKPQTDPQTHPFDLKLLIPQQGGKPLPVTIDPEVKNPPPPGG